MKPFSRLLFFILGFSLILPANPSAGNIIKVLSCLDNPSLQEDSLDLSKSFLPEP